MRHPTIHAAVRRTVVELVVEWARRWCFHGVPVRLGGCVVAHPCGEREIEWAPHFNVIFGLLGVEDDQNVRIGRYKVARAALDDLRFRWGVVLAELGWNPTCSPQVFYEWRDEQKKRHALRYFLRSFPSWNGWTHRVTWWGLLAPTVGWKLEGYEPTPWNEDPAPKPCTCRKCAGPTLTLEIVARNRYDCRDPVSGIWRREKSGPAGAWRPLWLGT